MAKKQKPERNRVATLKPGKRRKSLIEVTSLDKLLDRPSAPLKAPQIPVVERSVAVDVVGETTPEQQAVELADLTFKALMVDEQFAGTISALIGLRRAYAMAMQQMQERAELGRQLAKSKDKAFSDLVEDYARQIINHLAVQPFSPTELLESLQDAIIPWLVRIASKHAADDAKEAAEQRQRAAAERAVRPIAIGFAPFPTDSPEVQRKTSVVFVGWRPAVMVLLDHLAAFAVHKSGQKNVVIRMKDADVDPRTQHTRLVAIAVQHWQNACNTAKTMMACLSEHALPLLGGAPDLIICDELSKAYSIGFAGRPPAARAGDAHKQLRRWCDRTDTALVGGILLPENVQPDFNDPAYDQLRLFTALTSVTAKPKMPTDENEEDMYQIMLGAHAQVVLDVPAAAFEQYTPKIAVA